MFRYEAERQMKTKNSPGMNCVNIVETRGTTRRRALNARMNRVRARKIL